MKYSFSSTKKLYFNIKINKFTTSSIQIIQKIIKLLWIKFIVISLPLKL